MAVIALTSASGAPGVTTAAVGLALTWNRSVIMVDADPGAHQAVLAGYLRGQLPTPKGLQRVAEAHRDRRPLAEVVSDETVPLTEQPRTDRDAGSAADPGADRDPGPGADALTPGPSRRLLPGFLRPANAALFAPVWPDLVDAFVGLAEAGIDVIIDLGRMDRQGLPQPLVDRADLVALVSHTSLRAIAGARGYVAMLREQARLTGAEANLGLVLVGENQPYGRREIGKLLSLPVLTALARDAESAAAFSDGSRRSRRFERAPLARSLHNAVVDLNGHIRRRRSRLGLDEPAGPVPTEPTSPSAADTVLTGSSVGGPTPPPARNAWLRSGGGRRG